MKTFGLIFHLTNEPRIKVHDLSRIALHCMIHAFCILRYISVVSCPLVGEFIILIKNERAVQKWLFIKMKPNCNSRGVTVSNSECI